MDSKDVLRNIDILELILSPSLDKCSLARCAHACKLWTEPALDALWRNLDCGDVLFKVISLQPDDELTDAHLQKLLMYGRRIRRIDGYNRWRGKSYPSDEILKTIELKMPAGLTPNLQHLRIGATESDWSHCSIFIHKCLRSLVLHIPESRADAASLAKMLHRTPLLRELMIRIDMSMKYNTQLDEEIRMPLRVPVPKLPEIERVELFIRLNHPSHIGLSNYRISSNPTLLQDFVSVLSLTRLFVEGRPFLSPDWPCSIGFRDGLFVSLVGLELEAGFAPFSSCLPYLPRLTSLRLKSFWEEDASSLNLLLGRVSKSNPFLHLFYLGYYSLSEIGASCLVTFRMLQQHSVFARLKVLQMKWPLPLQGSNHSLSSFLSQMPLVESLDLNPSPRNGTIFYKDRVTLDVLPSIAIHCPHLQSLSLFADLRIPPTLALKQDITFCALESIIFGESPIAHDDAAIERIGIFFCGLLPRFCTVTTDNIEAADLRRLHELAKLVKQ